MNRITAVGMRRAEKGVRAKELEREGLRLRSGRAKRYVGGSSWEWACMEGRR